MKRRAFQIVVLLLLGAIVNIAVAWSIAYHTGPLEYKARLSSAQYTNIDVDWLKQIAQECTLTQRLKEGTGTINTSEAFGALLEEYADSTFASAGSGRGPTPIATRFKAGWPVLTVVGCGYFSGVGRPRWLPPTSDIQWSYAIPLTKTISGGRVTFRRTLPFLPIWPGFAINTIFYAAVLLGGWVMFFAPGTVRRAIRRKRGQCENCAYPIGSSPVCTECGNAVTIRSVEHA